MANSGISSTGFDAPLYVELTPSRALRRWVGLGVGLAALSIAVLPISVTGRSLAILGVVILSLIRWRRMIRRQPLALRCVAGTDWSLMVAGRWFEVADLRCTYLSGALVVIAANLEGAGSLRFPILADQTENAAWRRLRRRLVRGAGASVS